jgi:hypothetical protein
MTTKSTTGVEMLDAIRTAITRYVVMPNQATTDAVTLWIAATHAQPAWAHAPRLVIRGPERRCGKSRLLDVVEALSHDPLLTVNASAAAVYRSVNIDPPVILVDEADTIFGPKAEGNEDLRGLLNAGHQRNRPAIRYDAATNSVQHLETFAMAALAGIGQMPDTIEDRAIIVRMRRRAPGEKVDTFRYKRDRQPLRAFATKLTNWLRVDLKALERIEPDMPIEDRAADTWEPLVIIADHAGGDWPDRARNAAKGLTEQAASDSQVSDRVRLLADCRKAFGADTALSTATLLDRLKSEPEAPWAEYGPAGLTAMRLGNILREYEIRSGNIRFSDGIQAKGYQRVDFTDAWNRYCPRPLKAIDGPESGANRAAPIGQAVPAVPATSAQVNAGTP